jgi:hypothetical protein
MKIKSDMWQVTSDKRKLAARELDSCHPSPVTSGGHQLSTINYQPAACGFALVITLILLSVTLIMAVAFLAISRRERGAVVTTTDAATARYAADAALANAEAQIISSALATTNPYINNLLVSTNFINAQGFTTGSSNPTNVSYNYNGGGSLSVGDFEQNVANLLYLPRVPVFVPTNALGASDFRFYLDLNRNGNFEDSGPQPQVDSAGLFMHSDGTADSSSLKNVLTNFMVGDPQWIGVLERPDAPHGPNNQFLARYAFVAVPADNIDLNYSHNQASTAALNDGYFRNQGVGSWEINLAAFLADLNTNQWGQVIGSPANGNSTFYYYQYQSFNNQGSAFYDAQGLLGYRYNYNPLPWLSAVLPNYPNPLAGSPVDVFPFGPAMTNTAVPSYIPNLNKPWPGADNTNHFFAQLSDLYTPTTTERNVVAPALGFTDRLLLAGNTNSTYDRYTFYRLLAQLGTDSSPDAGKMNLNYDNLDPGPPSPAPPHLRQPASVTNFMAWTPLAFFTNAADRMLRLYTTNWFQADPPHFLATYYGFTNVGGYYPNNPGQYFYVNGSGNTINYDQNGSGLTNIPLYGMTNQIPAFGITNIPVYINGQFVYRSAVQRVLQLAANIYDASTNSFYPSRFRPVFTKMILAASATISTTNVYVSGYANQVTPIVLNSELNTFNDLAYLMTVEDFASSSAYNYNQPYLLNIYGVPWIIGAKKGFPNFNEFSMENSIQVTRKLQVKRQINPPPIAPSNYQTNQMYSFCITNFYGIECWNSYSNIIYPPTPALNPNAQNIVIVWRTQSTMILSNPVAGQPPFTNQINRFGRIPLAFWPSNSFVVPLNTNDFLFSNNAVNFAYSFVTNNFSDSGIYPLPQFFFSVTNYLQLAIIDYSGGGGGQIVDYVHLGPLTGGPRNINAEIADANTIAYPDAGSTGLWSTNLGNASPSTIPQGVINQIMTSRKGGKVPAVDTGEGSWDPNKPQLPAKLAGQLTLIQAQQLFFTAFFSGSSTINVVGNDGTLYTVTNLQSQMQAPYTPSRLRVQRLTWQANDPLVHYLASDLNDLADDTNSQNVLEWKTGNIGLANSFQKWSGDRYEPWGNYGNASTPDDPKTASAKNMALKDPNLTSSAGWNFPTNKYPTVGWLGRVHRGTPWQTVYLKALDITNTSSGTTSGTKIWRTWTGDFNTADAINERPVQDRLLFDIFSISVNDNASRGRLSVNVAADTNNPAAGLAAWSAVLSGIAVPTNAVGGYTIIPPAGAAGISSPFLGTLVQGINNTRANTNLFPKQAFEHVADILSVRALTEQSPFLTPYFNSALTNQMTDEMYEWLPQQTLSLLQCSTAPRYVIYCYGQTLKPAPNGVVTSGPNLANGLSPFGMVTNYQVVAETATRAVVQFRPVVVTNSVTGLSQTNYAATLEQFNPLPPD